MTHFKGKQAQNSFSWRLFNPAPPPCVVPDPDVSADINPICKPTLPLLLSNAHSWELAGFGGFCKWGRRWGLLWANHYQVSLTALFQPQRPQKRAENSSSGPSNGSLKIWQRPLATTQIELCHVLGKTLAEFAPEEGNDSWIDCTKLIYVKCPYFLTTSQRKIFLRFDSLSDDDG